MIINQWVNIAFNTLRNHIWMHFLPNRPNILSSPPSILSAPVSTPFSSRGLKFIRARNSLLPFYGGVLNLSQSSYSNSPISLQSPDIIEVENFLFAYEITFEVDKHVNECNFFLFLHLEISDNWKLGYLRFFVSFRSLMLRPRVWKNEIKEWLRLWKVTFWSIGLGFGDLRNKKPVSGPSVTPF